MKLVHWPLMGGLLHLVQQGKDRVGPQPAHAFPRHEIGLHSVQEAQLSQRGRAMPRVVEYFG